MNYKGSCHCGKVQFEVEADIQKVIECNCSHCSRKGFLFSFLPKDNFKMNLDENDLTLYKFNKHAIDHRFCPVCGCQPFGFGKNPESGSETVAINVRCLENIDLDSLERQKVNGKDF